MQQNNHSYSKAPQLTVASVLHSNTTCNKTICPSSLFFSLLYTLSTSSLSKFVYLSRLLDMQYNNTTTTVRTQTTSLIKFLHSTSKPHLTESSFPRSLLFSCLLSRLRFLAKSTAEKKELSHFPRSATKQPQFFQINLPLDSSPVTFQSDMQQTSLVLFPYFLQSSTVTQTNSPQSSTSLKPEDPLTTHHRHRVTIATCNKTPLSPLNPLPSQPPHHNSGASQI